MSDATKHVIAHPWRGVRPFERHSMVLLVAGLVYVLIGVAFIATPMTPAREKLYYYALEVFSFNVWGLIFIFAGILSIISSKWPPFSETWGYTVLTGLSVGWSLFYIPSVVGGHAPATTLTGTLTWGLLGFLWWAVGGLINPQALVKLMNEIRALQAENLSLHRELARRKRLEE